MHLIPLFWGMILLWSPEDSSAIAGWVWNCLPDVNMVQCVMLSEDTVARSTAWDRGLGARDSLQEYS